MKNRCLWLLMGWLLAGGGFAQQPIEKPPAPGSPAAHVAAGTQSEQALRPHWPLLVKMWRGEGPVPGVWLPSAFKGDPAMLQFDQPYSNLNALPAVGNYMRRHIPNFTFPDL
jgi:hypothetical protein